MYGKHFSSMYEGSMVGSGSHVFALMGYIIAHWKPDETVGGQVRLNPTVLATIFGETEERVQNAIDFLCAPDPRSTTPDEDGRRLVKIGQFDYRVVNAAKYAAIKHAEEQREANRTRQAKHRDKKRKPTPPRLNERVATKKYEDGDDEAGDRLAAMHEAALPYNAGVTITP